ncbi:unnamed protein product, partial [Ectocarpus fasciculatus]
HDDRQRRLDRGGLLEPRRRRRLTGRLRVADDRELQHHGQLRDRLDGAALERRRLQRQGDGLRTRHRSPQRRRGDVLAVLLRVLDGGLVDLLLHDHRRRRRGRPLLPGPAKRRFERVQLDRVQLPPQLYLLDAGHHELHRDPGQGNLQLQRPGGLVPPDLAALRQWHRRLLQPLPLRGLGP